jgi:hypothetical protein
MLLREFRALGKRSGVAATQLQGDRVFCLVVTQVTRYVAEEECAGRDHLGVKQSPARQLAMEEPTVAVGPVEHRRDTEPVVDHRLLLRID